jgi:hypothetical protein
VFQEEKERTSQLPAELQKLRLATQSTLELAAYFLLDENVKNTCKAMVTVLGPYMQSHSEENKTCRSTFESAAWLAKETSGGAYEPLLQSVSLLGQLSQLQECGLAVRGCLPGVNLKLVGPLHPAVMEQDRLAHVVGTLTMNMVKFGLNTAIWYTKCFPQACFAALLPDHAAEVLERMRRYKDTFERQLADVRGKWWTKCKERSALKNRFTQKVA